jgi:hypothetical protein
MPAPLVKLSAVTGQYVSAGGAVSQKALDDVDLWIVPGEIIAILGAAATVSRHLSILSLDSIIRAPKRCSSRPRISDLKSRGRSRE